jgi:hypothetical protein
MADENISIVTAPRFYVSSVQQFAGPNDVMLVFGHNTPTLKDGAFSDAVSQAVTILNMSPQTAKELSLLLQEGIAEVERQFGPLRTPFIDERTK